MSAIVLTPSSCTNSGNNTATTSWSVQCPVQVTGDIIICHLVSDSNITHGTLPGGPNGETAVVLMDSKLDGGGTAGVCVSVWYWIATGSSAANQRVVTPSASEQWQATVVRLPAGEYDTGTPIQYASYFLAGSSAAIVSPNLIPNRAGARAVFWAGIDADTVTAISQQAGTTWTLLANVDVGAVTGVFAYRETVTGQSVTITSGNLTGGNDNYVSIGYLINEPATYSPVKGALTLTGKVPTVVRTAAPDGHFISLALLEVGGLGILSAGSSKTLDPVKGALTLTGKQATVEQTTNQVLEPAKGSLSLAGYVPTLAQPQVMEPVKGTLTLTGYIATVAQTAHQTLEAVTGHLTATGYAPGLERTDNQTIGPPTVGNLALAGQTATVSQPRELTPTVAGLTLTGYAPSLTQPGELSPEAGHLTLTGYVAEVAQPRDLTPTQGALTLTGKVPTLDQEVTFPGFYSLALLGLPIGADTGNQALMPGVGHLTLAGYVPTVIAPVVLAPTKATLTLAGKVATVGNQEILVQWDDVGADEGYRVKWGLSSGSYSWSADVAADVLEYEVKGLTFGVTYYIAVFALVGGTEQEASVEQVFTAGLWHLPTTGHLTLAGKVPAVGQTQSLTPTKGALTLGGKVPDVSQAGNQSLTPVAGALTLGGKVATLSQPFDLTPAKGALTLTGRQPDVTQGAAQSVTPSAGSLALFGYVPTVGQTQSLVPVLGHLALTGYAPSLTQARTVDPTKGALSLTGYIPTVAQSAGQVLEPVAGALTLTGYAPEVTLVGAIAIVPQTGNLTLRGYVPTITGPNYPRTGAGGVGGGRGRKPKRVIWVEPEDDGPVVEVESAAEVPKAVKAIKRQAKAIAKQALRERTAIPELPKWVVHGDAPFADDLRQRIEDIRANFAYVYQLMLIEQRRRDEEDEEDVFLLTL